MKNGCFSVLNVTQIGKVNTYDLIANSALERELHCNDLLTEGCTS